METNVKQISCTQLILSAFCCCCSFCKPAIAEIDYSNNNNGGEHWNYGMRLSKCWMETCVLCSRFYLFENENKNGKRFIISHSCFRAVTAFDHRSLLTYICSKTLEAIRRLVCLFCQSILLFHLSEVSFSSVFFFDAMWCNVVNDDEFQFEITTIWIGRDRERKSEESEHYIAYLYNGIPTESLNQSISFG